MKEKPILFSGEMVRAILAGDKTQTRRVVGPESMGIAVIQQSNGPTVLKDFDGETGITVKCPYGQPGDRLWVRENCYIGQVNFGERSFNNVVDNEGRGRVVGWSATMNGDAVRCAKDYGVKQTPSIHMPRWASRITLEIVRVRVERVQAISGDDAVAEGIVKDLAQLRLTPNFRELWDSINAKRGFGWDKNPWVWIIEFKTLPPEPASQTADTADTLLGVGKPDHAHHLGNGGKTLQSPAKEAKEAKA